ncbi:MAG: nodulation protein NfeD [Chloroflexi bacterium]|nr:nodulation protein NfeD [Chloroflexota bacterium]
MNKHHKIKSLLIVLLISLSFTALAHAQTTGGAIVLTAEGPVTPVMVSYIQRGISTAEQQGAQVLIIKLNTPGGQRDLMKKIVNAILESETPVVVYVAPRGAIAGSAGTVITLAGHLNAMAPETAIGAASPVGSQGEDLGQTIDAKLKNALKAEIRNYASERPEEAIALAESMIDEAKAATADEAKAVGLTDFIADDVADLLRQLDGHKVEVNGRTVILQTANAPITELSVSLLEEILGVLTNPNIVFLLITIGAQAILIELSSPGGWVAGFIGAICLALAFYGLGVLPVNWFGIVFIILAFALFILDVNAPTHGALTAAAVGSLIVGALVLFNSPGSEPYLRISIPFVVGTSVVLGAAFFGILLVAFRTRYLPVAVGVEALVGKEGEVRQPLAPGGTVQVGGELWSAETEDGQPIEAGQKVEVVAVKGLKLKVRKRKK